jgi:Pectobacterium phage endonuclease
MSVNRGRISTLKPSRSLPASEGVVEIQHPAKEHRIDVPNPTTYTALNGKVYPLSPDLLEKFMRRVDKSPGFGPDGDCWRWTGKLDKRSGGYGKAVIGRNRSVVAHRLSYVLHKGDLPHRNVVRHLCNNSACVNPDHLEPGNHLANMRDKYMSGRSKQERGYPNTVAWRLREVATERGYGLKELAEASGVPYSTVQRAWRNHATYVELGLLGVLADALQVDVGELLQRVA